MVVSSVEEKKLQLLDVTLSPSTAIIDSVAGEFTEKGNAEIVTLGTDGVLRLYRIDKGGVMEEKQRLSTWSTLRSLTKIRFPGESRDWIAFGSDAGEITLLDWNKPQSLNTMELTKSGCRRSAEGQYICADPKGRAIMISAVEKRKLILVVNPNAQPQIMASPLSAHRERTIHYATVGLENGHDNPLFATLELQYPTDLASITAVPKQVAYYELDLGLNHVSRTYAVQVPRHASVLAAVPCGGVLVGGEDWICYVHENVPTIACPLPRRQGHKLPLLVTLIQVFEQSKKRWFALAQSELGDVYKITIEMSEKDETKVVTNIHAALLDSLPNANALNVNKLGMLFGAFATSNHVLYQFERIDLPSTCSGHVVTNVETLTTQLALEQATDTFCPQAKLQNLRKLQTRSNPSPSTDLLVGELAGRETSPQLYRLVGSGPSARLDVLRHGRSVTELASSPLPGIPGGIFTIANNSNGQTELIVVSFADATLVLSVGESIQEVTNSLGLLTNAPTLACGRLEGADALVQVHASGVRHVVNGQAKQWHCPGLKRIETASANTSQVLVAMAGGEIIYFHLDQVSGNLTEAGNVQVGADVCSLHVGPIVKGERQSLWAAVGCRDLSVRILSLNPRSLLQTKSTISCQSRPHSLRLFLEDKNELTLMMGLEDGSCVRTSVDSTTGATNVLNRRFLGARPVAVSELQQGTILGLSSRPWMYQQGEWTPLSYRPLDHGSGINNDSIASGVVATAGQSLRILTLPEMTSNEAFHAQSVSLSYTPRQLTLMPSSSGSNNQMLLCVVEADTNMNGQNREWKSADKDGMDMEDSDEEKEDEEEEAEDQETEIRGPVEPNAWGSCLRLLDPTNNCQTLDVVEYTNGEAALCSCLVRFHSKGGEALLAVGTVTNMTMHPLKQEASHICLYRIVNNRFQLLHKTLVKDGPVLALAQFQGRLLAGIGKTLRLYEMGKRQLLRKTEIKNMTMVKTIQAVGDRAYCGDLLQSIQVVRLDTATNSLGVIASDACPRPIVCQELLDWNTVAVADKFGNVSVLRVLADSSVVPHGSRSLWNDTDKLVPKMELLCQYHVGEVVTSLTRCALVAGGAESLVYVTVTGRIGALVPLTTRADVDFYRSLEGEMQAIHKRSKGYRSYYGPVMGVVDASLCEAFGNLSMEQQTAMAEKLDLTVGEIAKRLEDTKTSLM